MIKYSSNKLINNLDKLYVDQNFLEKSCEYFKRVKNEDWKWIYDTFDDPDPHIHTGEYQVKEVRCLVEQHCSKIPYREGYITYYAHASRWFIDPYHMSEKQVKLSKCSMKDRKIFRESAIELVRILLDENTSESKKTLKQVIKGFNKYYKRIKFISDSVHFCTIYTQWSNDYRVINQFQFNADKYDESIQVAFEQKIFNLFKEKATQNMEKDPILPPEDSKLKSRIKKIEYDYDEKEIILVKDENPELVYQYRIWREWKKDRELKNRLDKDWEKEDKEKGQKASKELEWVKKLN